MLANWFGWVQTLARAIRSRRGRPHSRRLRLEPLEDRRLLSTFPASLRDPDESSLIELQRSDTDDLAIKPDARPESAHSNNLGILWNNRSTKTGPAVNKAFESISAANQSIKTVAAVISPSKDPEKVQPLIMTDTDADDSGSQAATISAKVAEAKNAGKSPPEPVVVKQTVSSENSKANQLVRTVTSSDDDDDNDFATGTPKSIAANGAGKSSPEPSQEDSTLDNSNGNLSGRKERAESVISLEQPSIIGSQVRGETRPNEVTANPGTETRSDLSREVASANRRDLHKGLNKDDEGIFSKPPPGTAPASLLDELGPAPIQSSSTNIWDAAHLPSGSLLPQTELEGVRLVDQGGILDPSLAKAGESPDLREMVLATGPLWGAFFLQSLGRLRPRPHQPTIMVVEGDETKRDQLVMSFTDQGYLVLSAPTTHDAMGLLRTPLSPIDLVVLNLNLPDLSGLHLCTYLRKSNPGLQLMVYSDEAEPSELPQLLKLGVSYFRQNPFSLDELIADVNSMLH